jgi:hypothetical protein
MILACLVAVVAVAVWAFYLAPKMRDRQCAFGADLKAMEGENKDRQDRLDSGGSVPKWEKRLEARRGDVSELQEREAGMSQRRQDTRRQVTDLESRLSGLAAHVHPLTLSLSQLDTTWQSGAKAAVRAALVNALNAYDQGAGRQVTEERERLQALRRGVASTRGVVEACRDPLTHLPESPPQAAVEDEAPQATADSAEPPGTSSHDLKRLVTEGLEQRRQRFAELQRLQDQTAAHLDWVREALLPALDRLLDREDTRQRTGAAMEEAGFREIRALPGTPSDGRLHEEIARGAVSERYGPGQVIQQVTRGYEWRDMVLRRAQVVVATDTADAGAA